MEYSFQQYAKGTITRIHLKNFKNYSNFIYVPSPKANYFFGGNYTGKTALLHSILFGIGGTPTHYSVPIQPSEFITRGKKNASIELHIIGGNRKILKFRRCFNGKKLDIFKIDNKKVTMNVYIGELLKLGIDGSHISIFLSTEGTTQQDNIMADSLMRKSIFSIGGEKLNNNLQKYKDMSIKIKINETEISIKKVEITTERNRIAALGSESAYICPCILKNLRIHLENLEKSLISKKESFNTMKEYVVEPFREKLNILCSEFSRLLKLMKCSGYLVIDDDFKDMQAYFAHEGRIPRCFEIRGGGEISIIYTLFNLALTKVSNVKVRMIDNTLFRLDSTNQERIRVPVHEVVTDPDNTTQFFVCTFEQIRIEDLPLTKVTSLQLREHFQ